VIALLVAGAVPACIAIVGLFLEEMIKTIIVFGSAGIYIAFQMIVLGALVARAKGWRPSGAFSTGVWAWPVNLAALTYGLLAIINMVGRARTGSVVSQLRNDCRRGGSGCERVDLRAAVPAL